VLESGQLIDSASLLHFFAQVLSLLALVFHLSQVLEIGFVSLLEFIAYGLEVEQRGVVGQEDD